LLQSQFDALEEPGPRRKIGRGLGRAAAARDRRSGSRSAQDANFASGRGAEPM